MHKTPTCQQWVGLTFSKIYCVSGDLSSSYLSNGNKSITIGSQFAHENSTVGSASRDS